MTSYLDARNDARTACASAYQANVSLDQRDFNQWIANLSSEFVNIPKGKLPDGTEIESFQATVYPVTRYFWKKVMETSPRTVPESKRETWDRDLNSPVNYLSTHARTTMNELPNGDIEAIKEWETGVFVEKLNQLTEGLGCIYDLPTRNQLIYMFRGDATGTNRDPYSLGVTDETIDAYITYRGNSEGELHPVGQKRKNAFGIEVGNVLRMAKDSEIDRDGTDMRPIVGWGFNSYASNINDISAENSIGSEDIGFSLIRICNQERSQAVTTAPQTTRLYVRIENPREK